MIALDVDRQADKSQFDHLISNVRATVSDVHEISTKAVLLVRPFSLPRTTGGKMQRLPARQMYGRYRLKVLARWVRTNERSQRPLAFRVAVFYGGAALVLAFLGIWTKLLTNRIKPSL